MNAHVLVNKYMKALNVKAVFTRLEIWTEKNLVKISLNLQEIVQNFDCWRDGHLLRRVKPDVAHMIISQSLGKYQGHAFLSGTYTAKNVTSVKSFSHEDIRHYADLTARGWLQLENEA